MVMTAEERFPHQGEMQKQSIVKLVDADGLPLEEGVLGTLTSDLVHVDKVYAAFMPETEFGVFIIESERLRLMTIAELDELGIESVYPELPEDMKVEPTDTVEDYLPLLDK